MTIKPKIKAESLTKVFHSDEGDVEALKRIDLTINEGDFAALLGPSGCGKSTFLYIVGGFEKATGGSIYIDDQPLVKPGPDRGIVFQEYVLFDWMTVEQLIRYTSGVHPSFDQTKAEQVIAKTDIKPSSKIKPV